MKAMVLAAGLGTRLRPLTNDRPKALVQIAGKTLLEITLRRLSSFGIRDVIINVHHFADMIAEYLQSHRNFGMHLELSREQTLLDTGGGLKQAAWFLDTDPFILHNVDIITDIDLNRMVNYHLEKHALATLAVQDRDTSRYLTFDQDLQLRGRRSSRDPELLSYGFSGIHVISNRLLSMLDEGLFSIVASYLDLAAAGQRILAFPADSSYWRDLGQPEHIAQAAADIESGRFVP